MMAIQKPIGLSVFFLLTMAANASPFQDMLAGRQALFVEVFGEKARFPRERVEQVKALEPGERLWVDSDGDGRVDFDPETYANPGDETTPPLGEGDPGCQDPSSGTESPQCQDGVDNDGDGSMDYDAGYSANGSPTDPPVPDPQCVAKPWRNREAAYPRSSYPCGLGAELALLLPALMWMRRRL